MGEWVQADDGNRLATAGDMLAATLWEGQLSSINDFSRLKPKAKLLVMKLDQIASEEGMAKIPVAEVAGGLMLSEKDLGPTPQMP